MIKRINFLRILGCFWLYIFSANLFAETNYLELQHQEELKQAEIDFKNAKTDFEKGYALELKAGALNSLKKPDEALVVINEAMKIDSNSVSIAITKAKILFAINKCDEAIATFEPYISKLQQEASGQTVPVMKRMMLANLAEGYLIETFTYMQQEQWDKALNALKDTDFVMQGVYEGASPFAYRAVLYQYILMRSKYSNDKIPELAQAVKDYEDFPKTYYGYIIKLLKGQDVKSEFMKHINKLTSEKKQDALAEWLFYEGAYKKYALGDNIFAVNSLKELDKLLPYGSIEWLIASRLFTEKQ